jgi:hypothetical protein
MAYAFIYRDPTNKGGRGKKNPLDPKGFSAAHLSQARAIFEWSRTKAADVLNGALPFDQVLKEMNGEAEKSSGNTAKITKLRDNAPDLADLVDQHRLDLEGALSQTGRNLGGRPYQVDAQSCRRRSWSCARLDRL